MDYWEECITGALEEAGLTATKEQIDCIVGWVEGAHENYGMAHGHDCIPNPMNAEVDKLKTQLRKTEEAHERQIRGIKEGVALRRHVDVSQVHIEDDGHVTYDLR